MFKKLKSFSINPKAKKLIAVAMCMLIGCTMMIPLASATDAAVTDLSPAEAGQEVFDIIHQQLNFQTVLSVLGVALASGLAIYLGWWGIRKVTSIVMRAFSKGKLSA